MNLCHLLSSTITTLIMLAPSCYAGPCSKQINDVQIRIDAKLNTQAAAGPRSNETAAATDHRQPTPKSIAAAEIELGDVSRKTVQAVGVAMARARKADLAGEMGTCEQALADARRALGD
jgi:hypothetical protein